MALRLMLTVDGETQLLHAFDRWEAAARDMRVPFGTIAAMLLGIEQTRFAAQGPGWAPLSPAYAAWKARHFPGRPILQRTGRLLKSMVGEGDEYEKAITADSLTVRSMVPYGGFHQHGTARMPARLVIDLSPEDAARIALVFKRYLMTAASDAGFRLIGEAA